MRAFFAQLLDSGNRRVEGHLLLVFLGALTLIFLSLVHVIALGLPFDPASFGEGFGLVLAGGGAAAWGQGLQRAKERDFFHDNDA
ncbi:MAG: hypothetical protein PHS57_06875 [Alphaproteobacteria bacterium]|nr:hypothetical protein [Alphaproteobacteria bacterium]